MQKKVKMCGGYLCSWMALACAMSYVLGGSKRIIRYFETNNLTRIVGLVGILLFSSAITYYVFRKYNCFERIGNYKLRDSMDAFIDRYHLNRIDISILLIAVVIGGFLRILGCNWGITSIFQPDEVNIVKPAISMAMDQTLYQRTSSYYPAQFATKLVSVAIRWYYEVHNLVLRNQMVEPYFIYRYFTAVFSTMTIYVSFLIGNYMKKHLGTILACLVAVFPIYVSLAKQVTGDSTSLLFLLITVLFSLRYMEEKKKFYLILMTLGTAMATLEKWHGAIGCGYIAIIVIWNSKSIVEVLKKVFFSFLSYIGWIGILSPNMLMHPKWAIIDGFLNIAVYEGGEKPPYLDLLRFYTYESIRYAGGGVLILLLVVGIIYLVQNRTRQYLVLTLGILKVLILCFMNRSFFRWELEFFWGVLLILAIGVYALIFCKWRTVALAGYTLSTVLLLELGLGSVVYLSIAVHSDQDNRLIQEQYCMENGITPENSTFGGYTGFQPGAYISKSGTHLSEKVEETFVIVDDTVYKKKDVDYAMYIDWEDYKAKELLKNCPVIKEFDIVCRDVMSVSPVIMESSWNDLYIMSQYWKAIDEIHKGAMTGSGAITIYDVSEIPYLQE